MPPKKKKDYEDESDANTLLLKLMTKFTDLIEKNYVLNAEVNQLKADNVILSQKYDDQLSRVDELEKNRQDWSTQGKNNLTAPVQDVMALISTVADELQARKEKESNLVVQGLPESPSDDEESQKDNVLALFNSISVRNPRVIRAFRMGRRTNKPRPIKVLCENRDTQQAVLSNAKRLKNSQQYNGVFIREDMTQLQRDNAYRKRQENRRQATDRTNMNNRNQQPAVANTNNRNRQPAVANTNNRRQQTAATNMNNRQQQPAEVRDTGNADAPQTLDHRVNIVNDQPDTPPPNNVPPPNYPGTPTLARPAPSKFLYFNARSIACKNVELSETVAFYDMCLYMNHQTQAWMIRKNCIKLFLISCKMLECICFMGISISLIFPGLN